ncbi:INO80 complex subunit B [Apostichopus japonicus]|uniref:INO80 complex subunit B n=1 Tax=Stichopus japonicus TaxID=307972 RepID=A0A2G8L8M6_STIJA|nr:INO80 complex subunit B [Apostichopus japonicus]
MKRGRPKVRWADRINEITGMNICAAHQYAQDRSGWNVIINRVTKEPAPVKKVPVVAPPVTPALEELEAREPELAVLNKKPKKHKHKKHKKRRDLMYPSQLTSTSITEPDGALPHLKLKIKLGGETFATKSVSRSSVTDAVLTEQELQIEEEDEEDDKVMEEEGDAFEGNLDQEEEDLPILDAEIVDEDDEEAWLEALEAGELNEHGELKKEKDVNLLTTRQKALLQMKADHQEQLWELPLPAEPSELTEEMIRKRAKQTIERLLKKQEVKSKLNKIGKPRKKTEGSPQVRYINSLNHGFSLSYPEGLEFPLSKSATKTPPPMAIPCGVEGCKNTKKYSCSKTGVPLCSLECYKENQRLSEIPAI